MWVRAAHPPKLESFGLGGGAQNRGGGCSLGSESVSVSFHSQSPPPRLCIHPIGQLDTGAVWWSKEKDLSWLVLWDQEYECTCSTQMPLTTNSPALPIHGSPPYSPGLYILFSPTAPSLKSIMTSQRSSDSVRKESARPDEEGGGGLKAPARSGQGCPEATAATRIAPAVCPGLDRELCEVPPKEALPGARR